MPGCPIIVIGASAGGIEALRRLIPDLADTILAAVAVVIHRAAIADDERLPRVLAIGAKLPVMHAADGDRIVPGRVYVAPAGVHLAVDDGRFRLNAGPRENASRPSIDVLFRTAAQQCGPLVIGVLLSGLLDDGVAGLAAIREHGGAVIVQDPDDAVFADMPRRALEILDVDAVLPVSRIGAALMRLAAELAATASPPEADRTHPPRGGVVPRTNRVRNVRELLLSSGDNRAAEDAGSG
jgi:two-component system, chemotaxis family, protein-glutamate methylesterase/glutaminase